MPSALSPLPLPLDADSEFGFRRESAGSGKRLIVDIDLRLLVRLSETMRNSVRTRFVATRPNGTGFINRVKRSSVSIGAGIFLSTILLSIVLLYGITKDRWRWRRTITQAGLLCFALIVLCVTVGTAAYLYNQIPITIAKQTELDSVQIGMTQNDVRYVKGYPPIVYGPLDNTDKFPGRRVIETEKLPGGKTVDDYDYWSYKKYAGSRIDVQFTPTKTSVVTVECYSHDKLRRCPSIAGVYDGDSEQKVIRVFGRPDMSNISGVTKSIYYKKFGVFFKLTQQTVYLIGINDTRYDMP